VLQKDLKTEGIFRISGDSRVISSLRARIDKREDVDFKKLDTHTLTGLMTTYILSLPDSLFPYEQHSRWNELGLLASDFNFSDEHVGQWNRHAIVPLFDEEKTRRIKDFLIQLNAELQKVPTCSLEVIRWLLRVLEMVILEHEHNKMGLCNFFFFLFHFS